MDLILHKLALFHCITGDLGGDSSEWGVAQCKQLIDAHSLPHTLLDSVVATFVEAN